MSWLNQLKAVGIKILTGSGNPFVDEPHARIHQGQMFMASFLQGGVAQNASMLMALITPAAKYTHLTMFPAATGEGEFNFYDSTAILGGDEVAVYNMKRASGNVFGGSVLENPTVVSHGSLLSPRVIPGGAGVANTQGSSPNFELEWLLSPDTTYLFELINRASGAETLSLGLCFYVTNPIADVN